MAARDSRAIPAGPHPGHNADCGDQGLAAIVHGCVGVRLLVYPVASLRMIMSLHRCKTYSKQSVSCSLIQVHRCLMLLLVVR